MTDKEKTEKCRYILYCYTGRIEFADDIEFLYSIFECHPQWEQKQGCGVDYFYIGKTKYNNLCFYIMRTDGTTTDISFTTAIKEPTIKSKVLKAFRSAIRPEIEKFKKTIKFGADKCPITGYILIPSNTHIDHYDLTFKELIEVFTTDTPLEDYFQFINETKDNEVETYFTNQNIIDSFVNFHNANTNLRAVTKQANLSILKKATFKQQ
jgi:hypothetical protein